MSMSKQFCRAHSTGGKFRRAVENVHVSLGHTLLGTSESNSLWHLASGPPPSIEVVYRKLMSTPENEEVKSQQQVPAFYVELNSLMEQYTSKDYKKFRYDVLESCSSMALFKLNEKTIAEKLLRCLLDRSGGSFSTKAMERQKYNVARKRNLNSLNHDTHDNVASDDEEEVDEADEHKSMNSHKRGVVSESFEAFAKLTIAFARDAGYAFVSKYYGVFHMAINAGMYDKNGQFINDVNRLQFIFHVQCGWIREMSPYITVLLERECHYMQRCQLEEAAEVKETSREFNLLRNSDVTKHNDSNSVKDAISHVIKLILTQWSDTKMYVRRLSAELLAYLCRLQITLLPFVMEHINLIVCNNFVNDLIHNYDDNNNSNNSVKEESKFVCKDKNVTSMYVWFYNNVRKYCNELDQTCQNVEVNNKLETANKTVQARSANFVSTIPLFVLELLRGVRGTLNSQMERNYRILLRGFMLTEHSAVRESENLHDLFLCNEENCDNSYKMHCIPHTQINKSRNMESSNGGGGDDVKDDDNNVSNVEMNVDKNNFEWTPDECIRYFGWHVFVEESLIIFDTPMKVESNVHGAEYIDPIRNKNNGTLEQEQEEQHGIIGNNENICYLMNTMTYASKMKCLRDVVQRVAGTVISNALQYLLSELLHTSSRRRELSRLAHQLRRTTNNTNTELSSDDDLEAERYDASEEQHRMSMRASLLQNLNVHTIDCNNNSMNNSSNEHEESLFATLSRRLLLMIVHHFNTFLELNTEMENSITRYADSIDVSLNSVQCATHIRILSTVLSSSYYALWRDRESSKIINNVQPTLHKMLEKSKLNTHKTEIEEQWDVYAAILELCIPLCTRFTSVRATSNNNNNETNMTIFRSTDDTIIEEHERQLQKRFMPIAKHVVQELIYCFANVEVGKATVDEERQMSIAFRILYSFVQDVLQRNYALQYVSGEHESDNNIHFTSMEREWSKEEKSKSSKRHGTVDTHHKVLEPYLQAPCEHDHAMVEYNSLHHLHETVVTHSNGTHDNNKLNNVNKSSLTVFALTLLHMVVVSFLEHGTRLLQYVHQMESNKQVVEAQKNASSSSEELQEENYYEEREHLLEEKESDTTRNNSNDSHAIMRNCEESIHEDNNTLLCTVTYTKEIIYDILTIITLIHSTPKTANSSSGSVISPLQQLMRLSTVSHQRLLTGSSAGERLQLSLFTFLSNVIAVYCNATDLQMQSSIEYRYSNNNDININSSIANHILEYHHTVWLTLALPLFYSLPHSLFALNVHHETLLIDKQKLLEHLTRLLSTQDEIICNDLAESKNGAESIKCTYLFNNEHHNRIMYKSFALYVQVSTLLHYLTFSAAANKLHLSTEESQTTEKETRNKSNKRVTLQLNDRELIKSTRLQMQNRESSCNNYFNYLLYAIQWLIEKFGRVEIVRQ